MKQTEIQQCVICGQGIMHGGSPVFYKVTIERYMVNVGAIKRQHGLELMLGNAILANVMGSNEDIAARLHGGTIWVCDDCGVNSHLCIAHLSEKLPEDAPEESDG